MLDSIIRVIAAVLVPAFIIGMAGSAIVVAITVVHDVHDFFTDDDPVEPSHDAL